jgi:hypothetical protein
MARSARSRRDDTERYLVEGERRGDLVDRAVAAPREDEAHAAPDGRLCQLTRVANSFGQQHFHRVAVRVDHRQRELGPRARRPGAGAAGNRIDDDGCRHLQKLGVRT